MNLYEALRNKVRMFYLLSMESNANIKQNIGEKHMQKKSWIMTLLTAGLVVFLFMGLTSARAAESVSISEILNDPVTYEGAEVEVTGKIVVIEYGLIIEDISGAQLLIRAGPLWYLTSPEGAGLDLKVGDVITVVGIVCITPDSEGLSSVHLAALEVNGVVLREEVGVRPTWAEGQTNQYCGSSQSHGPHHYGSPQDSGQRTRSEVAAGLCGGGSLTGLGIYGFRRI